MKLLRSFFEYLKRIYRFFHHGAVLSIIIGFYFNPSTALYMRVLWCQGLSRRFCLSGFTSRNDYLCGVKKSERKKWSKWERRAFNSRWDCWADHSVLSAGISQPVPDWKHYTCHQFFGVKLHCRRLDRDGAHAAAVQRFSHAWIHCELPLCIIGAFCPFKWQEAAGCEGHQWCTSHQSKPFTWWSDINLFFWRGGGIWFWTI